MDLAVAATVFALVFPAELPDKTALASLVLGSRYRPAFVFAGVAAAFAIHAVLAVAAGSLLSLLPHRAVEAAVAALFGLGAVLLWRGRQHPGEGRQDPGEEHIPVPANRGAFWRVAGTSFAVILVAEFGDLTQILTAGLAARYHNALAVGIGAVLALWSVAALAIIGGQSLLKVISLAWMTRLAAGAMLVLAGLSAAAAL